MMTTPDLVALANVIRSANANTTATDGSPVFSDDAIAILATFCKSRNGNFKRERWFDYIAGKCTEGGRRL